MHDPDLVRANALLDVNPHVRAAANSAGVRLADVPGTGPGGRHTLDDVRQAPRFAHTDTRT